MPRISQREKDEIVAAYRAGDGPTAIGRRYGISKSYVLRLARYPYQKKERPPKPKRAVKAPKAVERQKVDRHALGSGRRQSGEYVKLM
jgi:transposase-like protein